jgi:hypothetical protein
MQTAPTYTPSGEHLAPAGYDQYPRKDRSWTLLAVAAILMLALVAGGLLLVRSAQTSTDAQGVLAAKQSDQSATTVARSVASVAEPTVPADVATTAAPNNGAGNVAPTGNNNGAPAPAAPKPAAPVTTAPAPKPAAPAPVITSFTTPENIDCHNGNFQNFSASWTTTNAVKTTISIDGPGIYKTYGPNDSDSLPFNCSTPHTFLLTAYGQDGHTVTKSITLQPRNVQTPPQPGDEDE